jgi:hypothetical protein
MAVFIETSLGQLTAPLCTGLIFTDVTDQTVGAEFCGFIEDFAAKGITGGCGDRNFCPDDTVTRGQMAVFIEAALGVMPAPACAGDRFGDVNATLLSAPFCGFIEDFLAKGITAGCQVGPPALYCPSAPMTRAEMAVFLVAAPPPLKPFCGGIAGFPCPEGLICVDVPNDDCDPNAGGADCAGMCVLVR